FPGLERGLVLELAVVHELADRWPRRRRDLNQIEVGFLGQPERVVDRNDPDLLAGGSDQPDLGNTDALVYTRFGADVTSLSPITATGISGGRLPVTKPAWAAPDAAFRRIREKPRTPCRWGNHHGGQCPASPL